MTSDLTFADGAGQFDQLVPEALVVPLSVIVLKVLSASSSERLLAEEDELVETLTSDGQDKSLREGIQVRASAGQPDIGDTGVLEDAKELLGELFVPVMNQQALVAQEAIDTIDEVPSDLGHKGH